MKAPLKKLKNRSNDQASRSISHRRRLAKMLKQALLTGYTSLLEKEAETAPFPRFSGRRIIE